MISAFNLLTHIGPYITEKNVIIGALVFPWKSEQKFVGERYRWILDRQTDRNLDTAVSASPVNETWRYAKLHYYKQFTDKPLIIFIYKMCVKRMTERTDITWSIPKTEIILPLPVLLTNHWFLVVLSVSAHSGFRFHLNFHGCQVE